MNTNSSLDVYSNLCWTQNLLMYQPWSWCGFQTDLMATYEHCRKTSAKKKLKISRLKRPAALVIYLKNCVTECENSSANLAWRTIEYLIKEGVVPPLDPGPVSLSTHVNLHYRFDVVSRQLTGLDDPNPNLRINSAVVEKGVREQTGTGYTRAWYWPTT